MDRGIALLGVALAVVVTTSACSDTRPTDSFELEPGATRAVELYGQTGDAVRQVTLRVPTHRWNLRMDCIGDGSIEVEIGGVGTGDVPCRSTSAPGGGIGLESSSEEARTEFDVLVRAPKDSRWSVAVDVTPDR